MTIPAQPDLPISLLSGLARFYPERDATMTLQPPGRSLWVAVLPREDNVFSVASVEQDGRTSFSYQSAKSYKTVLQRPLPRWARYAAGMLVLLRDSGVDFGGFDAVMAGDEGNSGRYEYALGLGFAAACYTLASKPYSEALLLDYAERVRREYVGE